MNLNSVTKGAEVIVIAEAHVFSGTVTEKRVGERTLVLRDVWVEYGNVGEQVEEVRFNTDLITAVIKPAKDDRDLFMRLYKGREGKTD